jgi:hypothetical protein
MPKKPSEGSLFLLDACCLINLFATGRIEEILRCLPWRFATSQLVATREVLAIRRSAGTGDPLEREVISLAPLERSGSLTLFDLSTDEEKTEFLRFAMDLDDGEASVCALAVTRGGGIATDDRKALRILDQATPQVSTVQTPEILYEWAHLSQAREGEIGDVLRAVRDRARFYPRRDAPRFDWWESFF